MAVDAAHTRWLQRLESYETVLGQLLDAVAASKERQFSELEKAGTVQYFELSWELGWKLMADYLIAHQTPPKSYTATMAIRGALAAGIIDDGDAWLAAGELRHALSHGYALAKRDQVIEMERSGYPAIFAAFRDVMRAHAGA